MPALPPNSDEFVRLLRECARPDSAAETIAELRKLIYRSGVWRIVTWMGDRRVAAVRDRIIDHVLGIIFAVNDSAIAGQVKKKLKTDAELRSATINVKSHRGEVRLTVSVANAAEVDADRAIALALGVEDVTKASFEIALGPGAKKVIAERSIEKQIRSRLQRFIASVDDGSIPLDGCYREFVLMLHGVLHDELCIENPGVALSDTIRRAIEDLADSKQPGEPAKIIRHQSRPDETLLLPGWPHDLPLAVGRSLSDKFTELLDYRGTKIPVTRGRVRETILALLVALAAGVDRKALRQEFLEKTFLADRESVSDDSDPVAGAQYADPLESIPAEPMQQHALLDAALHFAALAECIEAEMKRWGAARLGYGTISDFQIMMECAIPRRFNRQFSQQVYAKRIQMSPGQLSARLKAIRGKWDELMAFLDEPQRTAAEGEPPAFPSGAFSDCVKPVAGAAMWASGRHAVNAALLYLNHKNLTSCGNITQRSP